jgi:hypothetical protein
VVRLDAKNRISNAEINERPFLLFGRVTCSNPECVHFPAKIANIAGNVSNDLWFEAIPATTKKFTKLVNALRNC